MLIHFSKPYLTSNVCLTMSRECLIVSTSSNSAILPPLQEQKISLLYDLYLIVYDDNERNGL